MGSHVTPVLSYSTATLPQPNMYMKEEDRRIMGPNWLLL